MGAHSPSSVNALRFLAASAVMLPAMRRGFARPEMRRDGLELGLWLLIGYSAQSLGVAQTTAGHAAFATTFTVLTVPLKPVLLRLPRKAHLASQRYLEIEQYSIM